MIANNSKRTPVMRFFKGDWVKEEATGRVYKVEEVDWDDNGRRVIVAFCGARGVRFFDSDEGFRLTKPRRSRHADGY